VKYLYIVLIVGAVVSVRLAMYRARKRRGAGAGAGDGDGDGAVTPAAATVPPGRLAVARLLESAGTSFGDVGTVAAREIKDRLRGKIFRFGTLILLLAVAAAIVIPTLHKGSAAATAQTVGVVGTLPNGTERVLGAAGSGYGDNVKFVAEPSEAVAAADLRSGTIDMAIIDSNEVLLDQPVSSIKSPADSSLVEFVAQFLGVIKAYHTAHLSTAQAAKVTNSKSAPIHSLEVSAKSSSNTISVIGLVLLFFMLTQYNTWILIGVMQEKSSRVVEVLLATLRPLQLLGGKVLGIGLVALGQAAIVVAFALALADIVGSDILHGAAPLAILTELLWLVLGYGFYCWVYAAAGSMAERQDQVQTLALPLSIPILVGYIFSITVAASGHPDLLFKILAYVPPTAPFCMSVLVGLSDVTWWQFILSVLITLVSTAGMAVFAARIYKRAVLQTGRRVHLKDLLASSGP
jgi:ABC-2 type transport system permease protein